MSKMKVAIVYGWSEGPWQGRRMRAALQRQGFKIIRDPAEADIILAHSEGCYWLPRNAKAKLIVLIGVPYWPGRRLVTSTLLNLVANVKTESRQNPGWWFAKLVHNLYYIFRRPNLTIRLITKHKPTNLPKLSGAQRGLLIRGDQDTFCHPNAHGQLPQLADYRFAQLPGVHDDCWMNPVPYIDLICKHI